MPPKRMYSASTNDQETSDNDHTKPGQTATDCSAAVKKRLATSTRTGQACDRCKTRKIRCDGLPGGCSPCLQNQTECQTTDRITGRAAPRGYVAGLESTNAQLRGQIQELESILRQRSIDPKPLGGAFPEFNNNNDSSNNNGNGNSNCNSNAPSIYNSGATATPAQSAQWNDPVDLVNSYHSETTSTSVSSQVFSQDHSVFNATPTLRTGFSGDHRAFVSAGMKQLTSFKGTALSILGMEIDIADFACEDMDEPEAVGQNHLYNKSYQAFIQSTHNINLKVEKIDLPGREEGLTYARWYFRVLDPFFPILHEPTFMKLLTRIYDDPSFVPTVAQTVMVHMMFAIMFFQYAVRNRDDTAQQTSLNHQSNLHYHYSLGMFFQLFCSRTLADAQAMTLICSHLRNFPKPGASWALTCSTLGFAIELGLHRSAKTLPCPLPPLEVEIRKRVFWGLLAIHVTLSGKLGRPCYIRMDDFDIEMPSELLDEQMEADPNSHHHVTSLKQIGMLAIKLLPLFMELYATLYAVRRNPDQYIENIRTLEGRIRQYISELPVDLINGQVGANEQEARLCSLYIQAWICEFRMLLYHPSSSMTNESSFNKESLRICLDAARSLLGVVEQITELKSLDTTWYNASVYVMAITTTLFAQWQQRDKLATGDIAALRTEMDRWLDVMRDVGHLLGSGEKLRDAVRNVTNGTIGMLDHNLSMKSGYPAQVVVKLESASTSPTNRLQTFSHQQCPTPRHNPSYAGTTHSNSVASDHSPSQHASMPLPYSTPEASMPQRQTQYSAAAQYPSYTDAEMHTRVPYTTTTHQTGYSYPSGLNGSTRSPVVESFMNQAVSQMPQQPDFSPHVWQEQQPSQLSIPTQENLNSASQSWQSWTNTVACNLEPQDCYSANTPMQLGGRDMDAIASQATGMNEGMSSNGIGTSVPMADINGAHMAVMAVAHSQNPLAGVNGQGLHGSVQWPLNIFDGRN